jgi:hypothetical protein
MRKMEFYTSILLMIFSLLICLAAYKLSTGAIGKPGPGFTPFLMGAMLFVLAVFYFFKTLRLRQREEEILVWQGLLWGKVILVFVLLFAYALLLERGGFLLCTLLFLATIFSYVGKQRWHWIYIGSPAITFLFYAVFKIWLKIQLPVGFMGI